MVKHSKATHAKVGVSLASSDVVITVKDNGQGMEATMHNKPGIGLSSIRNKIDLLKGSLTIESTPGESTQIKVLLPHQIQTTL